MTISRQKINFGVPFTITRPKAGEKVLFVENFNSQPFDSLKVTITNSSSYPPPQVWVSDEVNQLITLKGFDSIPQTTALELLVQGVVATKIVTEEKKVLLSDESLAAVKDAPAKAVSWMWLSIKRALILFMGMAFCLWLMKGTQIGDAINNIWSKLNAAQAVSMVSEIDPRIHTNRHPVYKTSAFTQVNSHYKRRHGDDKDLTKLYNFVGNEFFMTHDLTTHASGQFMLLDHGDAQEYCEGMGGRLPTMRELAAYLAGEYLTVENVVWPVSLRANVAEWTSNNVSWDNYFLYLKRDNSRPISKSDNVVELDNKYKLIEVDDGEEHAFRCGFPAVWYMPAKER